MPTLATRYRWYFQKLQFILFRLINSQSRVVDRNNVRLLVRDRAISDEMFWHLHHDYEGPECTLLNRHLDASDTVLEIGAGIGYLAVVSLKRGVTRYAAVEANADLLRLIEANLNENGITSCQVINAIVSDTSPRVSFKRAKNFWSSRISEPDPGIVATEKTLSTKELLERIGFDPTLIIVDIEGGEKGICFERFANCRKILIELHPQYIGQEACSEILSRITTIGFEVLDRHGRSYYLEKRQV